jgi:hypothetical protein
MTAECKTNNGVFDITGLTIDQVHQIKISLIHLAKKNLPNTTREDRSFNEAMVKNISDAQHQYCSTPVKQLS